MYIIIALLAVIAVSEITRLVLTHLPRSKKGYFKRKFKAVGEMIWDLEFKIFKTREMREGLRKEYDYMNSRLETINVQIKNWPEDGDKDERARLDDQLALATRDAERLLEQIKGLDAEVEGIKPSAENHAGIEGMANQVEALQELRAMLGSWIRTL